MTGFLVGLAAGIILAVLLLFLVSYINSGGTLAPLFTHQQTGYRKMLLATVGRPFDERAVKLAARMVAGDGTMETLYVAEIPLNRPLESDAEQELTIGMEGLEESARIARQVGVKPLPRLEKSRLGSKTIVEIQRSEGFDAVVLDIRPGNRSGREGRKIAQYVQEHATCTVVVISGQQNV